MKLNPFATPEKTEQLVQQPSVESGELKSDALRLAKIRGDLAEHDALPKPWPWCDCPYRYHKLGVGVIDYPCPHLTPEELALKKAYDKERDTILAAHDDTSADLAAITVGFVTVLTLTEPPLAEPQVSSEEGREESPEESPEENPAETKLDSEDWLLPSPGSGLPESGVVWVNGEDNDHAVSLADVIELDPSFEEKRKHILVTCLRGESNFDYDGLSPLGAHCCKQLVSWLETSDSNQWDLSYADLRGVDLTNVDLRGVNLEGADLGGAWLVHANLRRANLRGANIKGANLSYADLREAELRGPERERGGSYSIDFAGVSLRSAKVKGARVESGSENSLRTTGTGFIVFGRRSNTNYTGNNNWSDLMGG